MFRVSTCVSCDSSAKVETMRLRKSIDMWMDRPCWMLSRAKFMKSNLDFWFISGYDCLLFESRISIRELSDWFFVFWSSSLSLS